MPQELTSLHGLVPEGFAFEASTEQLQGVWATADHQASLSPRNSPLRRQVLHLLEAIDAQVTQSAHAFPYSGVNVHDKQDL